MYEVNPEWHRRPCRLLGSLVCTGRIKPPFNSNHPRTYGENFSTSAAPLRGLGSPPYVRGKYLDCPLWAVNTGLTPVRTGKITQRSRIHSLPQAHPRMCGENQVVSAPTTAGTGSPPYVRGKFVLHPTVQPCHGLTPVCAGKIKRN